MPQVSVIIPCYNAEKYIETCLDSVCNQTLKDIEIICIDDYSNDNTVKIIKEYSKKDNRITLIESKKKIYAAIARNKGLEVASGEYVAFMDSDDFYPDNDVLSDLYKTAKHENVKICGGGLIYFKGNKIVQSEEQYSFKINQKMQYINYQFDYGFTRFIYNREFLKSNNIRFPNYIVQEDPVFFVKAMFKAKEFFAMNRVSYCYRVTEKEYFCNYTQIKDCFTSLLWLLDFCKKYKLYKLYGIVCARLATQWFAEKAKLLVDKNGKPNEILDKLLKSFDYKIIYSINPRFKLPKLYEKIVPDLYKISVIIPVYNVKKYLKKCINSVISQTYKNLEIILVDDGSPDSCPEMCDDFAKKDTRIKVIHKKNGGLSSARNAGLDITTGQYVYFLDSDDYIEKETLETMLTTMQKNKVDIVIAGAQPFYIGKNKPERFDYMVNYFNTTNEQSIFKPKSIMKLFPVAWGKLYKKNIIDKYNLHFDEGLINEDESFNWYYNTKIKHGIFIPNKFYNYLIRQDSIMGRKESKGDKICDSLHIVDNVYYHLIIHKLYKKYKKKFIAWAFSLISYTEYLAKEYNNQTVANKCKDYYVKYNIKYYKKYGRYKPLEQLFSIKRSPYDDCHVLCVLGIKIKLHK